MLNPKKGTTVPLCELEEDALVLKAGVLTNMSGLDYIEDWIMPSNFIYRMGKVGSLHLNKE